MNFILIVSDTLRRDHLGCYGNDWISTPHIDRFAERSLVFDQCYAGSFPTVPNRRDIITGRFTASYTPWAPLSLDETILSEVLLDAGYLTMMVCDCPHILENGYHYDRGFEGFEWIRGQESDRWRTDPEKPAHRCESKKLRWPDSLLKYHRRNSARWRHESDRFVARTMAAASEWLEDNYKRKNFLLYVDTFDPHEPWDAPQWYVDMYDPGYDRQVVDYPLYARTDFLTPAELKHCRALYAAEVSLVDRWVGRLFERIEDLGLLENTMVLFTTDHGFLHGEHGFIGKALVTGEPADAALTYIPLYEEISHIPCIVHLPGAKPGRTDAVVQPMDIMPTVLEQAGLPIPETVHGRSFCPVLKRTTDHHRRVAFSAPFLGTVNPPVTVTQDRWSAILYPRASIATDQLDAAVDGVSKRQSTASAERPADLFFDLKADPCQLTSVAELHPESIKEARKEFAVFLRQIGTQEGIVGRW